MSRAPIKNTCPDIDKYIKSIKYNLCTDRDMKNMEHEDLLSAATSMRNELEECIGYLESLRESNHQLRQWGEEEEQKVDELELEIEKFNIH